MKMTNVEAEKNKISGLCPIKMHKQSEESKYFQMSKVKELGFN